MKALKIIGLIVLVIIVAGGVAAGGYFLAIWHTNEKDNAAKTATTDTSKTTADAELTPAKKVTLTTCNADELSLATAANGDSGAGTLSFNLVLTNIGKRDCILGGYPGVSLVNDNGNQIGTPAERTTNVAEKTVTLKPTEKAQSTLYYTNADNYDDGVCKDGATKLRVYPPNDTGYLSVILPSEVDWCPEFQVSPVF